MVAPAWWIVKTWCAPTIFREDLGTLREDLVALCEDLVALRHRYIQPYTFAHTSYVNHPPLIAFIARTLITMTAVVHDVLIVGAGPGGLAVAARLREPTPSAVFTDAEHNRYQWVKKHSGRMNLLPRGPDTARSKCSFTCRRNANGYGSSFVLSEYHG